ncbi:MAG: DUF4232 domain-containing protein [Acidobacteriaceae bacterium]|nr:DUF4232 domain-containing protein [Acidobacteriaceae bacterium]MBV9307650.1 DUF4232 domain-containing protein [Acidobacteriaceae bacterium]
MNSRVVILLVFCCWPLSVAAQTSVPDAPVCRPGQLHSTGGPGDGAMGSQYTEIIFQNVSSSKCRLTMARLDFQQFDAKGVRMPIQVNKNVAVNMDGSGTPEIILRPQQETAISIQSLNRTGYDESRRCATKMRISLSVAQQRSTLFAFETISCREDISVSGFHVVRE